MEAFLGTVLPVGFNFAPRGWAFCNGQLMSIAQNSALFSLLGTVYGGDGVTTFALPDLRGRVPVGSQGNGPGLQPIQQGERAGTNNVTVIASGTTAVNITAANLPAHTHPATMSLAGVTYATTIDVGTDAAGGSTPMAVGSSLTQSLGTGQLQAGIFTTTPTGTRPLAGVGTVATGTGTVTVNANTGGGQTLMAPVSTQALTSIMQPYLGLNYIIATSGIFPSRN